MAAETYDKLDTPYGPDLIRSGSPLATAGSPTADILPSDSRILTDFGVDNPPLTNDTSSSSSGIDQPLSNSRVWTSGWYKSHSYTPGENGWLLEGAQGFIDVADLRVGRFGISIIQTDTGTNSVGAVTIENASDQSAISILKTGLGSGLYIRAASATALPATLVQLTATSTNFYKMEVDIGGSPTAVTIQRWISNGANPNGTLSASAGDTCNSSDGNEYICQGGTTWKTVVLA